MNKRNYKNLIIKGLILFYLILMFLFPHASLQGASSGLLLWFHTVLPSLLPFIIVSNLLIRLNITKQISKVFYPMFHRVFRVSLDGCYPIFIGFLSGIPMGAKSTGDLVCEGKIKESEGNFLLTMCNNSSPMFIMSYIAISQLKLPQIKYTLIFILYGSAILSAMIYQFAFVRLFQRKATLKIQEFDSNVVESPPPHFNFDLLDRSIMNGFEVITKIGGYIILFSILAEVIKQIGPNIGVLKATIMGLLEITTGINQICSSDIPIKMQIVLVAVITSFGGLSGMAQTKSVIGETRLSMKSYFIVKVFNAILTFIFASLYVTMT